MPRPDRGQLKRGFTTGACAAAAAKAAAEALIKQSAVPSVVITMTTGENVTFTISECRFTGAEAVCAVIKDAGDDPDITHGATIVATVEWRDRPGIELKGGDGVGTVTRPGLEIPVGEPAINPVPRRMIRDEVSKALGPETRGVTVTVSVPGGEALARRTLNPRLGIVGGLSILGTTGIVIPYSLDAYKASIPQSVSIAKACGCTKVVASTGRRTEKYAQSANNLGEECFILVGDFMDEALKACVEKEVFEAEIWCMVGKASKLAAGEINTHFTKSDINITLLVGIAAGLGASDVLQTELATTVMANEFMSVLPIEMVPEFCRHLSQIAAARCSEFAGCRVKVVCIVCDYEGKILGRSDD
ncbi:cobalt-precorrin-5B (C(1))-methyltransferase [Dehalogenimonas formicexedens]|uniref:Cobalt-precorrin-5B C(1)-methyltransferase n=1 Tax=Dehalogenimonas formicexedens TaxID=1839801 RepID=A0A1P8F9F7_9CHLR|nr:cobalt-precorrin-5B (C(1))-methyltransferase [Dehalogenimonas formicexedens]APV45101.1 cobalt-precorrin-5B (C(1))-methyltransferase [Dehalogenimonas formicexedens]